MSYVVGADHSHPDPALSRLDHIICRVPDIERFHVQFRDELGFPEAWPIGRFWPDGRTSGIALGGVNLEFIQPDIDPPAKAIADTLVFEPTRLEAAERQFSLLGVPTHLFDKLESNPTLLEMRGFEGDRLGSEQLICRNLLLDSEFEIPMFLCGYVPMLKDRLGSSNPSMKSPYGRVLSVECQLAKPGDIWRLSQLGYLGTVELVQTELSFGMSKVLGIRLETGPVELKGIDPGLTVAALGDCGADGFCTATLVTESAADLGEQLLAALPALGYRVRSLGRTQPSLEDVFLAATRRSWDARLPDKPVNGDSRAPLPKF